VQLPPGGPVGVFPGGLLRDPREEDRIRAARTARLYVTFNSPEIYMWDIDVLVHGARHGLVL
jgi:hypothetical protein